MAAPPTEMDSRYGSRAAQPLHPIGAHSARSTGLTRRRHRHDVCFCVVIVLPYLPTRLLALISFVIGGCLIGCTSDSGTDETDETVAAIVQSSVHVVDGEPGKDVDVTDERISAPRERFAELEAYARGDVIVSGKGAGFMRRVRATHVEGDRVIVDTEPAAMSDVFQQVHLRGSLNDAQPGPTSQGLQPRGLNFELPKLAVANKKLPVGDGNAIEIVDGSFDFQPNIDFDLLMREGKLQHLLFAASGETAGSLRVRYDLHVEPGMRSGAFLRFDNPGVLLAETAPHYAVFMAGHVPVVVAVRAQLLLNWALRVGGDFTGEQAMQASGSLTAGVEYAGEKWRNLASSRLSVYADRTTTVANHQVSGEVSLTARLDVSLYDVAGPYVGLQAYSGLGHQNMSVDSGWFHEYGLRGLAGAQVAAFGKMLVGYEAVLFDLREQQSL